MATFTLPKVSQIGIKWIKSQTFYYHISILFGSAKKVNDWSHFVPICPMLDPNQTSQLCVYTSYQDNAWKGNHWETSTEISSRKGKSKCPRYWKEAEIKLKHLSRSPLIPEFKYCQEGWHIKSYFNEVFDKKGLIIKFKFTRAI